MAFDNGSDSTKRTHAHPTTDSPPLLSPVARQRFRAFLEVRGAPTAHLRFVHSLVFQLRGQTEFLGER